VGTVLQALHIPKILKPCHSVSLLGTLHPPNICSATCAPLVFFSCRVARSLALPHSTRLLLLGHSLPGLPTQSRRHHVPSLHRGHGHSATPFTSLGSGRHGPRGKTSSCCGATTCPTGSRNGTGLDATHPPRIWSVSPSDSLPGSVTARGHAWHQADLVTLKSSLSRPQWR
jgi:hypothetical protein